MPTAKKLPSGSWRCQVYSHTEETKQPDGTTKKKRIYKSFTSDIPGPKGKRLCEHLASEWAANKEAFSHVPSMTFGEALDRYIASRESVLSPSTIKEYKRIRQKHMQSLMGARLDGITQDQIQQVINFECQTHSPKTIRNYNGLISSVLGAYRPDFALHTVLPKKVRPELYIPSGSEIQRLMEYVRGTDMELPILLAAFGPMRRGEICALDSRNITGNTVHVCENMVKTDKGEWVIKSPKSYAGDRYIEYPDFVVEKFKGRTGKIVDMSPTTITNSFSRILKKAGISHFRFHDLRHYSASVQHALGIPDAYIMQRGGWGSDTVLKSVYRHAMNDRQKEMNEKANDYFSHLCNTKCNTN